MLRFRVLKGMRHVCRYSLLIYIMFKNHIIAGQGSKVCPYAEKSVVHASHVHATRDALKSRLLHDKASRLHGSSPMRDIFQKTSAFLTALRNLGCGAPSYEITHWSASEKIQCEKDMAYQSKRRRGYEPSSIKCDSRLFFDYDDQDHPYVR